MDTETIKQTIKVHASVETMTFGEMSAYSDNLLSKLAQQRKEGKFCDAILKVDKREFSVHRCVLAASSVSFEAMFSENCLDSNGNKVQIHSKYPDILVEVLDYIYTGNIVISSANIAEVVDLAVRLSLMKLQDYCSNYLSKNINEHTCLYIQDLAKQHGLASLVNVVDGFVFANILKLVESDSLLEINLHSLEVLISRSMPLLEIQRLNIVFRWIEHKRNLRKDSLPVLLKFVRWSGVPKNVLYEFFDDTIIVIDDDWMLFHVLMSLNNVDLLPDEYKDKFVSLKHTFMNDNNKMADENVQATVNERVDVADNDNGDDDDDDDATIVDHLNENDLEPDVFSSEISITFQHPRRESSRLALKSKKILELEQTNDSTANLKQEISSIKNKKNLVKKISDKENSAKGLNIRSDFERLLNEKRKKKERTVPARSRRAPSHLQKAKKVECSECPFTTNKQEKLVRHIKVAHKDKNRTFSCDICEFQCKWNRQFYDHLRTEHFTGPPYQCDRCGHSTASIQLLMLHRMDHFETRPHCCNVCNAKFKVKRVLDAHMRCHSGERPFECTVCSRSFATKGTLDQHKGTHSNQRPYLCDLCGFSTKYQSHLKTHSRIHTGEVFKCQYGDCNYQTPKRSQLACHQRSHLRVRCHTCSTCGRSFVERSHLVRHERSHLEERPFKCQQCDYESTRRDKLNEHCKKHHDNTTDDTNKMAYRPRKSRLLSSINTTMASNGKSVKSSSTSPINSKSVQPCKRRSQVTKHTASKRKIGHRILSSIPEDVALPASEEAAANSLEPSVVFVKRASKIFQPCKAQCGSKRSTYKNNKDRIDPLIAREAEMRKWLSKTTSEPPVLPIEVDTGPHQPSVTDISPHFHSFSSHYSSSSGISKGHSGASSSGLGSSRTGETNFLISPSANTAIPSDMSSPGGGSSSSGNLELSPTIGGLKIRGNISIHSATDAAKCEAICIPVEKTFTGTSQSQSSHSGEIHSGSLSLALQVAKKRMIQDKLRRLVNSKSSTTPIKKIFLQKSQPMSVITFKPDEPPNPGGYQSHS